MISDLPILKKAIEIDFDSFFLKVLENKEVAKFIEDLNKEQLSQSIDSRGIKLSYEDFDGNERTGYSYLTEKISKGKKKRGQPFTLYDTGDFYNSIKAMPELGGLEIIADPNKEDDNLFDKFGKDIIGLTYENLQKLQEFVKPIVQKELRRYLLQ